MEERAKRADFFEVAGANPSRELCARVAGLHAAGERVYVLAQNGEVAGRLNDELWSFDEGSFIPHALCVKEGENIVEPVAVGSFPENPNGASILVIAGNPRQEVLLRASELFSSITDFVPKGDENATSLARARYKTLRESGFDMAHHPVCARR